MIILTYISYAVLAASLIGTLANCFKKRWCFLVWLFTNAFWCIYNICLASYSQAILYAAYFALAVFGLVKWRKKKEAVKT